MEMMREEFVAHMAVGLSSESGQGLRWIRVGEVRGAVSESDGRGGGIALPVQGGIEWGESRR